MNTILKAVTGLAILTSTAALAAPGLHDAWDALLKERVKDGVVDYAGIHADAAALDGYLATLAKTDPASFTREETLAYWINAYNAFTVRLILDHYPLGSIRDISRPWKRDAWTAGGRVYSLDHIEHKILREQLKEPRIHFAIVCASIGCPNLHSWAFTGTDVEAQLDKAARLFMQSPKHVRVETAKDWLGRPKKTLHLSKIFTWFKGDFTKGGTQTVPEFVASYATDEVRAFIKKAGPGVGTDALSYDWKLNGK